MLSKTYYHRFGSRIEPIKENAIANVIKPSFMFAKIQLQSVTIKRQE